MTRIWRLVRRLAATDGAEIAEAALVLPLVFMLLLGIVWFGRAFNIYSTITQAAQQGALLAARNTCVLCGGGNGNDIATNNEVHTAVKAVMQASNIDPTQIKDSPNPGLFTCPSPPVPPGGCGGGPKIWVCHNVQLNPTGGLAGQPIQCGSVVSFDYPYQFYLPFTSLNLQQVLLSAHAESRMEN